MMNMKSWILLLVFFSAAPLSAGKKVSVGTILGKKLYWEQQGQVLDTLGGNVAGGSNTEKISSVRLCDGVDESGNQMFRVHNCTAIGAAILDDLSWDVMVLVQYVSETSSRIKVSSPGLDDEFRRRRIVSDFLWENVEKVDIEKPARGRDDYLVRISFHDGGESTYTGNRLLTNTVTALMGTRDELVISFIGNTGYENPTVKKRIFEVRCIGEAGVTPASLQRKCEAVMDKLGFGFSYTVPEFVRIDCSVARESSSPRQ